MFPSDNLAFTNLRYRLLKLTVCIITQIEIPDTKGVSVPFVSLGVVVISVHFRRKSSLTYFF